MPQQYARVLAVSGSPHPKSNTDRLISHVARSCGLEWEFVKLSEMLVRPCRACLGCVNDNICTQKDDFPALAEKVKHCDALIIGCYPPYGSVDAFTKAFLERFYSLRHVKGLNRGKLAVVAATGNGRGIKGLEEATEQVAHALSREGMEVLGRLHALGNPNCLVCGWGGECQLSAVPKLYPDNPVDGSDNACQVEDQPVWNQAADLGRELRRRLDAKAAEE